MAKRRPSTIGRSYVDISKGFGAAYQGNYETPNSFAKRMEISSEYGRNGNGQFTRKADKNRFKTAARVIRQQSISKSQNNYNYDATKEDAAAQHRATYRGIRTAFGMSAG